MQSLLTENQIARYAEFKEFVAANVEPSAGDWDRAERIPDSVVSLMARSGYLGGTIPLRYGGREWDTVTFGLLNEAIGRSTSALADLLTVQTMVSMTLLKWGTDEQKTLWLPQLAGGGTIGAFALTEAWGGSDLRSLQTEFKRLEGRPHLMLSGQKTWISYGQSAGLYLVFGTLDQKPAACLVPGGSHGLEVRPIKGMMGFRAAGLAELKFNEVEVPATNMIGKPGVALSFIAPVGLQYGRISTACSALGLLRGCLEESTSYAAVRKIGNGTAGDLGMIRSMIARMGTDLQAAGLLCHNACKATDDHQPQAFTKALMAKYFSSKAAARAASDAVQIFGATGCHEGSAVSRYYRDAKIMEIIEGTSQIHEDILGKILVDEASGRQPVAPRQRLP